MTLAWEPTGQRVGPIALLGGRLVSLSVYHVSRGDHSIAPGWAWTAGRDEALTSACAIGGGAGYPSIEAAMSAAESWAYPSSPESEPAPVAGTVSAKVARAASEYGIALRAQKAAAAAYEAAIGTDKVIPLSDAYQLRARATEAALAVLNEALGLDTGGNDA